MKRADKRKMARAIRDAVPGLYEKGGLLAATPRGRVLRGIYLEGSGWDPDGVYVTAFVQPLYLLADCMWFSLGFRLGRGGPTWSIRQVEKVVALVQEEGVPFFESITSPDALVNWEYLDRNTSIAREVRAYSLAAAGRFREGAYSLHEFVSWLSALNSQPSSVERPEWSIRRQQRAERLAHLAETNPTAASEQLAQWEKETIAALRIEDVP